MHEHVITILYDADCDFCNRCRAFVEARSKESVSFIFEDIGTDAESIVVEPETLGLEKFNACRYIARHMHGSWPTIGFILGIVPRRIGDWSYDWISKHRGLLMKLF